MVEYHFALLCYHLYLHSHPYFHLGCSRGVYFCLKNAECLSFYPHYLLLKKIDCLNLLDPPIR